MLSLSENIQMKLLKLSILLLFFWYLNDLLTISNNVFNSMGDQIYPFELKLNKVCVPDTKAPHCLDFTFIYIGCFHNQLLQIKRQF